MPRVKRPTSKDINITVAKIRLHLRTGDMRKAQLSTQKLLSYLSFLGLLTNVPESSLIPGPSDHSSKHPITKEKVIPRCP